METGPRSVGGEDPVLYQIVSIDGNTITLTDDFDGDTELNDDLSPPQHGLLERGPGVEPEYVTIKGGTAYVTLQENNAVAVVDIGTVGSPSRTSMPSPRRTTARWEMASI